MHRSGRFKNILVAGAIFLAALLPALSFGKGVQYDDSVPDLHIDPIRYLHELLYAWNPNFFLGMHTGFMQEYLTPYSFAYAAFSAVHIPALAAQRLVMFAIYAAIIVSVYVSLPFIMPGMHWLGRLTAGIASCWNIYVAFNSHGSSSMLLAYAAMPAFVAAYAAYLDARVSLLRAVAIIAGLTVIASGVNPPLLAINAAVIAMFIVSALVVSRSPLDVLRRSFTLSITAAVAVIAVNLYWIVPFLDFFHTVWLGGILSESTAMHNAATSFSNTLRGFGQWAIFLGDDTGPYYAWANSYAGITIFSLATWLEVIFAAAAIGFKANAGRGKVFFLACLVCSLPLVVGYYHGPLGTAITTPLYNFLFTKVPFFQIFRSVYKWESVVAFAIASLLGSFISASLTERRLFPGRDLARMLMAAAPIVTVLLAFIPVLVYQMNPPEPALPRWVANERLEVPSNPQFRLALMPSQYLEQFKWGDPSYYIESAIIGRPLVFGYLGSAPFEDSDQWMRRAYRAARSGNSQAADVFRTLGVATFLQRDDFRSFSDFAFTGGDVQTSTSQAHDMISRVLGAHPFKRDGANKFYHLNRALPVIHLASNIALASSPADVVAATFDAHALANGLTLLDPSRLRFPEILALLNAQVPVEGDTRKRGGLTATALLQSGWHAFAMQRKLVLNVSSASRVRLLVNTFGTSGDVTALRIGGGRIRTCTAIGGFWLDCGTFGRFKGAHILSLAHTPRFGWHALAIPQTTWAADNARIDHTRSARLAAPTASTAHSWSSHSLQTAPLSLEKERHSDVLPAVGTATNDLVVLPGRGTQVTAGLWLPRRFYLEPETYLYNRGEPQQWYALQKDAEFEVLSPLSRTAEASFLIPVSVFGKGENVEIRLNGRIVKTVFVPGAASEQFSTPGGIAQALSVPHYVRVQAALDPGVNHLNIGGDGSLMEMNQFSDTAGQAGAEVFGAMPFPPVVSIMHLDTAGIPRLPGQDVAARLQLPSMRLWGAPHITGTLRDALGNARRCFVVLQVLDERGRVRTSVVEIPQNEQQFNVSLPDMLANSFSDAADRVIGVWLVGAGEKLGSSLRDVTALDYTYVMRAFRPLGKTKWRDVTFRFPKGISAKKKTFNLPMLSPAAPLDKLRIRGIGHGLTASLALQFNDGKHWRLVGKRASASAVPSVSGRSAIVPLPQWMNVTVQDVADERLSVEDGTRPVAFRMQAQGTRVISLRLPKREAGKDVVVVYGSGEDPSPDTLVFGKSFDAVRRRRLRVVITFDPFQNTQSERTFTINADILTSTDAADVPLTPRSTGHPRGISIVRQSPVSISVRVANAVPRPTVLVFGESFHPMWHASTDGKTLVHVEANGFANAWLLPPLRAGQTIEIGFEGQKRFVRCAEVSLGAALLLVILLIREPRRRSAVENAS